MILEKAWLLIFIAGIIACSLFFFTTTGVRPESLWIVNFWLSCLWVTLFCFSSLVFGNVRQGLLLATGVVVYCILRINELDSGVNTFLLAAILVTLEIFWHIR